MYGFSLYRMGVPAHPVPLDDVLTQPSRYPARKAVIVVRDQTAHDFISGYALVSGKAVEVVLDTRQDLSDHTMALSYRPPYSWVFLQHDPN